MFNFHSLMGRTLAVGMIVAATFAVATLGAPGEVQASHGHGHYHGSYHVPTAHYHAPTVHYHRTYHHDYSHWTPNRGWHSHGHYHRTQHVSPGHWHVYYR